MSLLQADIAITEAEALRQENEALKDQLARLSCASISISDGLGPAKDVLQEIVNIA